MAKAPPLRLRLIKRVGTKFESVYEMPDGTTQTVALTETEYRNLALPGAGEPPNKPHAEAKWKCSYESVAFDTGVKPKAGDLWERSPGVYLVVLGALVPLNEKFLVIDTGTVAVSGVPPNLTVAGKLSGGVTVRGGVVEWP